MPPREPISPTPPGDPIAVCPRCNTTHDPQRCQGHVDEAKRAAYAEGGRAARAEASGQLRQCRQWPRRGHTVCDAHGAATRKSKAAAERAVTLERARQAMATYGARADVNPVDALLDEVCWTAGHVAWLRERVREIEQDDLVWGKTTEVDKASSDEVESKTTSRAVPHVWVSLYQSERKHLVEVCKAAIAAKIDERRVRLAERQGELIFGAIEAILADLQLTPEQHARTREVVPRHLRAITAHAA